MNFVELVFYDIHISVRLFFLEKAFFVVLKSDFGFDYSLFHTFTFLFLILIRSVRIIFALRPTNSMTCNRYEGYVIQP